MDEFSTDDFVFIKNSVFTVDGLIHRRRTIRSGQDEIRTRDYITDLDNKNSMQRSMSRVFVIAQCFGLCPVQGITSHTADDL
ncbi:hypothetical protein L9F63_002169, partial [Diploptera punctata]